MQRMPCMCCALTSSKLCLSAVILTGFTMRDLGTGKRLAYSETTFPERSAGKMNYCRHETRVGALLVLECNQQHLLS